MGDAVALVLAFRTSCVGGGVGGGVVVVAAVVVVVVVLVVALSSSCFLSSFPCPFHFDQF